MVLMSKIQKIEDNICIITFPEEVVNTSVKAIQLDIKALLSEAANLNLAFNFEYVSLIDSSGIGWLISTVKSRKQHDCQIVLYGVSKKIQNLFVMTGVDPLLSIYANQEKALDALKR